MRYWAIFPALALPACHPPPKEPIGRYTVIGGTSPSQPTLLVDTETGQTWRYVAATDKGTEDNWKYVPNASRADIKRDDAIDYIMKHQQKVSLPPPAVQNSN